MLTVKHFNFHWQDMTAPSIAKMTEIAHLGAMELNRGGKVRLGFLCLILSFLYFAI